MIMLMSCTAVGLRVIPAKAQTGDVSVQAVATYPLTDTLPDVNTPAHTIWFGVCIHNPGSTVNCNVTIYLNSVAAITVYNFQVPGGYHICVTSTTTSNLGVGTFVESAYVSCPGDQTPGDNTMTGDTFKIGKIGDINCDGKVNLADLTLLAQRYNLTGATINPPWIPEVDFNHDGKIDLADLTHYTGLSDFYNATRCTIAYGSSGPHGSPYEWSWACDLYRDGQINQADLTILQKYYGS
jgi:hypothetical protein